MYPSLPTQLSTKHKCVDLWWPTVADSAPKNLRPYAKNWLAVNAVDDKYHGELLTCLEYLAKNGSSADSEAAAECVARLGGKEVGGAEERY